MLQRLRQRFKSSLRNVAHIQWSLPIPEDIFRLLVEEYLEFDRPTLESLSLTCKAFALFCRQYIFQEVCIGTPPNSAKRDKPPPTLLEIKKAVERSPYILDFIQVLRIYDPTQGVVLSENKKSGPPTLNKEGKALQYILLRVKHLKVFELPHLGNGQRWSNLPSSLQDAICAVFRLNSLEEVSITSHYPLELVRWCTALRTLEYRVHNDNFGEQLSPVHRSPNPAILVQHLSLQDPCEIGRLVPYLSSPSSPVNLSGLKMLTYFGSKPPVQLPKIFSLSASTLESVKLYVQSNGTNPNLDFSMLSQLKHITLSIDRRSTMKYGFDWMPHSLKTFENATTCKLESIELIIRTGANFANDMMEGHWYAVDKVLQEISRKFGSLRTLRAVCCMEKSAWPLLPPANPDPTWIRVEQYIRGLVDLSHRSNLYTVEVAWIEDTFRRWTLIPVWGRLPHF